MSQTSHKLFAGTALAARIENAEKSLIAECATAASGREARAFVLPWSGGLAAWGGDGSPFNKVVGAGLDATLDEAALDAVEKAYAERGAEVRVELATTVEAAVGALLCRRGYVLQGFENVLALPLEPGREAKTAAGLEIRDCRADEFETWLDVVVRGFATPDLQGVGTNEEFPREVLERVFRDMLETSGFTRTIALRSGQGAGGASMRQHQGIAQLSGAATLPEHRRHGIQSSLLHFRLAQAAANGCDLAVVTTQPGSKSQENVQKLGFELAYARAVLIRPA